jgi:hypothetical protein
MADSPDLEIGRLLRLRAAVMKAAQVDATYEAAPALIRTYNSLREEMEQIFQPEGLEDLRGELERLFPPMYEPSGLDEQGRPYNPHDLAVTYP